MFRHLSPQSRSHQDSLMRNVTHQHLPMRNVTHGLSTYTQVQEDVNTSERKLQGQTLQGKEPFREGGDAAWAR